MIHKKNRLFSADEYVGGILKGDRIKLAQAITLVESTLTTHQSLAQEIIAKCLPFSKKSIRIAITGSPGVGKSTFIEALGLHLIHNQTRKPAVLAIDPSSQIHKGSILGDKTRMEQLSVHPNAFIRPSPAGDSLGGVARKTRETIILCEAAGYDTIIIETVGVGQSEITAQSMTDLFLLLLLPGAGDELQGIKRGIVEMADIIAVNKADIDRIHLAKQAQISYKNALHLFPSKTNQWIPQVLTCSALENQGIKEIWTEIEKYTSFVKENGFFEMQRKNQANYWFKETLKTQLESLFYENETIKTTYAALQTDVGNEVLSPFTAAQQLINVFIDTLTQINH